MRTRVLLAVAATGILALLTLAAGEVMARLAGFHPWQLVPVSARVAPGGRFFQPHPQLGYTHLPGRFVVELPGVSPFRVTHGADTLRVTSDREGLPTAGDRAGLWIFGCSYTHGWGLHDHQTYPWLVQAARPMDTVVNFGVSGYGTLHSLIQMELALSAGRRARVAVLAYGAIHDERNPFLRSRRRSLAAWNHLGELTQPFALLRSDGRVERRIAPAGFEPWPLARSLATVHAAQVVADRLLDARVDSHAVSEQLVLAMGDTAARHGIALVVAGITREEGTERMIAFAQRHGIPAGDISTDLTRTGYTLPADGHPSARANAEYAISLVDLLRQLGL